MVYEIILGRSAVEKDKWGSKGSVFIGKQYVKMGATTTLSQPVYLDLNKAHVVFVCGKRGSGKSYTLGVIAEGIANLEEEYKKRISVIMLDTMGIYWTMKFPNNQDLDLLKEWGLESKGIDIKIFCPSGRFDEFKKKGIPADVPFSLKPSELNPEDWNLTFGLATNDPIAVFIERVILTLKKDKDEFSIDEILEKIKSDERETQQVKDAAFNRFNSVNMWGIFSKQATSIKDLAKQGQISILDLSAYATMANGWQIKCLVMGIVCSKLFEERMLVRKGEEYESVHSSLHLIPTEEEEEQERLRSKKMPIVWIMIDEAHEFIPAVGKTAATDSLITLLREGRQPGIALILATQQPAKIHTDAMTQADIILSHRLTAKIDTDALASLVQSYLRTGLDKEINLLPRVAGACISVDDVNERMYPMRIRPRFSWHGGAAPALIKKEKKTFEF